MALFKDLGLVLRRLDYSETSLVLAVFCRETGMQRLIAKGVKRGSRHRPSVGIDLLELGSVAYSRRAESEAQLGTLTEWKQEENFPGLRRDLPRWYAGQYAADRTAQATQEGDPHPELFDALWAFCREATSAAPLLSSCRYLCTLLREVGLMPQLGACAGCGTRRELVSCPYFSARQGGLLCRDCEPAFVEKWRLESRTISAAAAVAAGAEVADADLPGVFDLLDYHLSEVLAKPSRVTNLLRVALGMRRRR